MRPRNRKVAVVLGTRPEIIKLSPVIRALISRRVPFFTIHTGQHYSFEMDRVFFRDLGLARPKYRLSCRSQGAQGKHVGVMMTAIEGILVKEKPHAVVVQGDTNSVLAGSLAACKMEGVLLGHVEAGLRSYDRSMPEEINRIVSDHSADLLFAPTVQSRETLLGEGISKKKIHVTGNTIVDAVRQSVKIACASVPLDRWGVKQKGYFLMTLHRQENVDHKNRLKGILEGVHRASMKLKMPVLFPIHPRTANKIKEFGLKIPAGIHCVAPVGFLEFLRLEGSARLLMSDSGGVQEEGCILGVPCVTLRTTTERPETVQAGANVIAGREPAAILLAAKKMMTKKAAWKNPFGDGRAGLRIVSILEGSR